MISIFIYENIKLIYKHDSIDSNTIFSFIKRDKEYSGKDVYIFIDETDNQNWEQRYFLSVELAGNLNPINGGYTSWKDDNDSYLLVNETNLGNIEEQYEIVEKGFYYLIKHK